MDNMGFQLDDEASLKTVEQEVILMRSLINERLNLATSKAERESAFQVITPAIAQVNKLVESLAKLAKTSDSVLGKPALQKLGDSIVDILIDELRGVPQSDSIIDRVAERIGEAISGSKNDN